MKKFAFMLGILALLLASSTTVYLTTVPDGTSVIFPDGTTAVTPCKIQFGWLSSRTVSISHQGFLTESRTLTRNTPKVDMVMQRQIMIDSQPQGADVTIDGKHHGVTPCQAFIPATISTANITVSKQGFLPQTSAFDCNGKENSINFRLPQNGSGRTKVSIKYENTGFPVFSTDTISNHKLGSPAKDSAECVAVLNDRQFPLRLSPFGKEHKLLVSIAQRHSIANRYTSRFYSLDCATGEMTPILSGRYYELNGTIRENSLIYASFKTGRFDYWKHDLKKPDSSPTLLLTNRLIKMEADVSADDTHILFSAYTPDEPPIPNIWMFVPDSATSSEPYLLC
ncbi:MAG: PEGA domain-containing protein, partial [Victivallales bacterium]|nr:PEGA domain-containing protein [Victivallales bacterium]